jgi:diacylglycerol O-acyltransferase / wax synthase
VVSYCGQITIALTSCREMMPDPAFYAECLQDSFDELRDAPLRGRRRVQGAVKDPATGETAPARAHARAS